MATVASLHPELLSEVFRCFQVGILQHQLCDFALVCRAWREPAQHALFGILILDSVSAEEWLDSPARTRYYVKSLNYRSSESDNPVMDVKVRAACAGLKSVCLDLERDGGYSWLSGQEASSLRRLALYRLYLIPFDDDVEPLQLQLTHAHLDILESHFDLEIRQIHTLLTSSRETLVHLDLFSLGSQTFAPDLVDFFAAVSFPNVQHLTLTRDESIYLWPELFQSFPSLRTFQTSYFEEATVTAIGASATAKLEGLTLGSQVSWAERPHRINPLSTPILTELLRIIRLPNLAGLRRLTIPRAFSRGFAEEAGLALLEECEKKSIKVLCRSGYLTRDMVATIA